MIYWKQFTISQFVVLAHCERWWCSSQSVNCYLCPGSRISFAFDKCFPKFSGLPACLSPCFQSVSEWDWNSLAKPVEPFGIQDKLLRGNCFGRNSVLYCRYWVLMHMRPFVKWENPSCFFGHMENPSCFYYSLV